MRYRYFRRKERQSHMRTCLFARHLIETYQFSRLRMASTSSIQPKLYVVQYDYVADALEKRRPYREAHLSLIDKQVKLGHVVLAGAIDSPPTGGLLILRNLSSNEIEQLVQQDPYVIHGVVMKYTIKPYLAVAGDSLLAKDLINI
jgi:uncharacterized protein